MKSKVLYCMVIVMTVCMSENLNAGVISVSFDNASNGTNSGDMGKDDLAGAPGVRVANWNSWLKDDPSLGIDNPTKVDGVTALTIDDSQVVIDNSGAVVSGFTTTISATPTTAPLNRWGSRNNNHDNDQEMYSDVFDAWGGVYNVAVSNVPYAMYDVYVYMFDDGSGRAGSFAIGNAIYYARGGLGNPLADGTGYILSSDTTVGSNTDIDQGNFVHFTNLTGSSFNLTLAAINAGNLDRNKVAGFQIVEVVPEPATMMLLGLGCLGLLRKKK